MLDDDRRLRRTLIFILLAIAIGAAIDLVLDRPTTIWSLHVGVELGLHLFSLGAAIYLWLGWRRTGDHLERTRRELESRAAERDAWRGRAEKRLRGVGEQIDRQLLDWALTPAERETALLLLKGYGHKDIATLQGKSERTVRQHSIAVYRKSGLSGRAELSAFFLEDLLLPTGPAAADGTAGADDEHDPDRNGGRTQV